MLEQVSTSVKFLAFFTASKQGKTGLTVTIDIYDPAGTQIVTGGSATAIGGGLYSYTLASNNSAEGEYAAIFKTSDSTVDAQHIPSLWVLGRAGVENLDAAISSRSTLTAAQVNAEADTALADVGLTSTITGRIDQAISSRLAAADYTAPTAAPSAVDIRTELDANSTKLANLDASVSSRLADADYTAPTSAPTVADIRAELATELGRIDASISSRLADADYVAPTTPPTAAEIATAVESSILNEGDGQQVLNAIVGAIGNSNVDEIALVAAIRSDLERTGGKLDSIPTTSAPSASAVASAVWAASTKEITGGTVDTLTNAPASVTPSDIWTHATRTLTSASGPTAVQIREEMDSNSTKLANLDAAISTRATPANIPTSDITAIKTRLDSVNVERVNNTATTQIVGTLLAQANS